MISSLINRRPYNTFHHFEIIQWNSHQHFVFVRVKQTNQAVRTRASANFYRLLLSQYSFILSLRIIFYVYQNI